MKDLMEEKVDLTKDLMQELADVKEKKECEKSELTKDLMQKLADVKEKKEYEKSELTKVLMQKLADVKEKKECEKSELTMDLMQKLADVKEKKEYKKSELSNSITNFKNDIKYRTELLLQSKRMCNVRGALEFIRSMIQLQDKTTSFCDPTDSDLMKLAQDAKFVSYLKQICLANNSQYKDVEKCMGGLYHTVSKQLHGHDKNIEIHAQDWSVNEVLALGALFHYYNIPYYYYDEEGQLTEYPYILQNNDHGHGTRVAALVGGKTFGVARKSNLIAVKVLNSSGSGTMADVLSALTFVLNQHKSCSNKKTVVNMSLGGPLSQALNAALEALTKAGIHVVLAAGNSNTDACSQSPSSVPSAITVGVNIISADAKTNTGKAMFSGTSQAAPQVAGAVALSISKNGNTTPAIMAKRIIDLSTKDVIKLTTLLQPNTQNRLLFIPL
ncbi:15478_t:CDS:2 [Entrophospora sp. SA101]|nr:15478_t:CDS:2 [Entrophospora sp. SA101]